MALPDSPLDFTETTSAPDWELLRRVFSDDAAHRHRMGLRSMAAQEFYAPTAEGAVICKHKEAALKSNFGRHIVSTPAGEGAARELARILRVVHAESEGASSAGFARDFSLAIEPDLIVVTPPDWTLAWASVCSPTHWSLEGKLGLPLIPIHDAVPGLNAQLANPIAQFFTRLIPGEGWQRFNWGLFASSRRNQHPSEKLPRITAATPAAEIYIRLENQNLMKLVESGAIAFGIRIHHYRWNQVMNDASLASRIRQKLRTMDTEIARYKGLLDFIARPELA